MLIADDPSLEPDTDPLGLCRLLLVLAIAILGILAWLLL